MDMREKRRAAMKIDDHTPATERREELKSTLSRLEQGIPFTLAEKQLALDRMNQMREENRKLFGESNFAVELIRRSRDNA